MPIAAHPFLESTADKRSLDHATIRPRLRYIATAASDAAIREAYGKQRQGDRSALKMVSRRLGWTRTAVCKRGAQLGITRVKERPWTTREEDLLECFGHLAIAGIQKNLTAAGYQRSIAAIQVKITRNRIKLNLNGFSANSLADALGVDVHKVLLWIRRGLLKADRRGTARTARQGGDTWWISDRAVRRFILQAPEEIDLATVEKIWFLDLVTGGKICA